MEKIQEIIKIDLSSKYVVIIPKDMPIAEVDKIRDIITEWINSDIPFMFITDEIKLVKVSDKESE